MIRRIALTLGLGVAVVTAGNRMTSTMTTDSAAAFKVASVVKPAGPRLPSMPRRSGYIVASS